MRDVPGLPSAAGREQVREQVWILLSDQALDQDVEPLEVAFARAQAMSDYTRDEVEAIWRYEVLPAVWINLIQIAGEWVGFDREWLLKRIHKARGRFWNRPHLLGRLLYWIRMRSYGRTD